MKLKILLPLIVLAVNGCASNDPVSGRIFNNASPYLVKPSWRAVRLFFHHASQQIVNEFVTGILATAKGAKVGNAAHWL
jgi:hypothetical protein